MVIHRNRKAGSLTAVCKSVGVHGTPDAAGNMPVGVLLKTFPSCAAPGGSWEATQNDMRRGMPSGMAEELAADPDYLAQTLQMMSFGI